MIQDGACCKRVSRSVPQGELRDKFGCDDIGLVMTALEQGEVGGNMRCYGKAEARRPHAGRYSCLGSGGVIAVWC